jgi:hypothetical protein
MTETRTQLAAVWPPTSAIAREAGHKQQSPLRAIRAKCLDCSCYQISEVRLCEAVKCPLWPFRAGRQPWHALAQKPAGNPPGFHDGEAFQDDEVSP